jgi:large subunit ribosomal protein L21
MYAVFNVLPGRQIKATKGETVRVDYLDSRNAGDTLVFDQVLMLSDGSVPKIGAPFVNAKVHATVVGHTRGKKVIVFKKKRRVDYHKMRGHKQDYTTIRIDSIEG